MKKSGFITRVLYICNSIVSFLLLVSFLLPYIPPSSFPTLSLLSLFVSPLLLVNLLFAVYWLIRFKKYFFLAAVPLLIAYFHFKPFINQGDNEIKNTENYSHTLKILSYNVRLFNAFENDAAKRTEAFSLQKLISEAQPDIICIQEYYKNHSIDFSDYPYQFIHFKSRKKKGEWKKNTLGHAIYSKYPLVYKGDFNFKGTYNNTLYANVVVEKDTFRLYNLHLQSLGVVASVSKLQETDTEVITNRMSSRFVKQQHHAEIIKEHQQMSPHPSIMVGDFNNTAYSYTYHFLTDDLQDAFIEKGKGLGTTFNFDGYPLRIDYILASEAFDILEFKTFERSFSDHYPIMTTLGFPSTAAGE